VRRWVVAALGLAAAGCASETVLWVRIEAPFLVPQQCDSVDVNVRRSDGSAAFGQAYDLSQGPSFPLTLSLVAQTPTDVDVPLSVSVEALKSGALAQPWAMRTSEATLPSGQLTQLLVPLCDCP
jgi:hypothetical protein